MSEETTPLVQAVTTTTIDRVAVIGILEQLLFAMSASVWLHLPDPKPDMYKHHVETLEQAFSSCCLSGSFEEFYDAQVGAVFEALTQKDYESWFIEYHS